MVNSDLDTDTVEYKGPGSTQSITQGSSLRREASFSRWCVEDQRVYFDQVVDSSSVTVIDTDFELPLLHQVGFESGLLQVETETYSTFCINKEQRMQLTDHSSMDEASILKDGKDTESYVPFDIENGSLSEKSFSSVGTVDSSSGCNHKTPSLTSKSHLSTADILKTLFFIFVWYTFSTLLTLYNKTLLGDDLGKFPAPLLMNTIHFLMQAVLSKGITWYWSDKFQPSVSMSWKDYFMRVVPTALGTSLDINLSNASLVFISVTFATMCKSAAPIFLLMFAFAFRLESPSVNLIGIILIISFGILLTGLLCSLFTPVSFLALQLQKETEVEVWGFIFVMLAAVMSGFRWCMTQILLQKESYGLKNPLIFMSCVTPVMALSTGLLSLIFDPWSEFKNNSYFNSSWHLTRSFMLMLFGGTLAFFMVLTEYVLISVTSAVTVTIAGVVKEAVTIVVAVFYFHDEFTWLKGVGLITIMVGVSLFNWYKYEKAQKGQSGESDITASSTPNVAGRYVILEEMDDQEDGTREQ